MQGNIRIKIISLIHSKRNLFHISEPLMVTYTQPPATAATTRSGSFPFATASGNTPSGD